VKYISLDVINGARDLGIKNIPEHIRMTKIKNKHL
jgi:hypothetical protein